MEDILTVNGCPYRVLQLLGHGKGGYSYLVESENALFVLKQIHHEPCSYYQFGDKLEAERRDYGLLKGTGIPIPQMLAIDTGAERILKEYIPGPTIYQLVKEDAMLPDYFHQVRHMAWLARQAGLNIDYFPTNFVVNEGRLYYVDYECNPYDPKWDFENWGNDYWWRSPAFLDYVNQHKEI